MDDLTTEKIQNEIYEEPLKCRVCDRELNPDNDPIGICLDCHIREYENSVLDRMINPFFGNH